MTRSPTRETTCCQWNWGPFSVNLCFVLFACFYVCYPKTSRQLPLCSFISNWKYSLQRVIGLVRGTWSPNCDHGKAVLNSHLTDQQHICPGPELALLLGLPQHPPQLFSARVPEGAGPQTQSSIISTTQGGIRISRKSPSQGQWKNLRMDSEGSSMTVT